MPKSMNRHRLDMDEPTSIRHMRGAPVKHFAIIDGTAFVWFEEESGLSTRRSTYYTYSSGDSIPDHMVWVASTTDPATGISAHLYKES